MKGKKLIFYFAILLFLLNFVVAVEDFQAYSTTKDIYVCPCATISSAVIVSNTGSDYSTYSITSEGTASMWTTIYPILFGLYPKNSTQVYSYITAPCDVRGEYDLITNIATSKIQKTLEQKVIIQNCRNIELYYVNQTKTSYPCEPASFEFIVKNTGTFPDRFDMKVDPSDYVALSSDSVVIKENENATIFVYVTPPCGIYGKQNFSFSTVSTSTKNKIEVPFYLEILPFYNYSFSLENNSLELCEGIKKNIPLTIRNEADVANAYYLSSENDLSIENSTISLWGNSNSTLNISILPEKTGKHTYNISVLAGRSSVKKTERLMVNVKKCFLVDIEKNFDKVCSGDKEIYNVNLYNKDKQKRQFKLYLYGPKGSTISSDNVYVDEQSNRTVRINTDITAEKDRNYILNVVAKVDGAKHNDSLSLVVLSQKSCNNLEFEKIKKLNIYPGEQKELSVTLKNQGIKSATYDLSMDGSDFVQLSRSTINIEAGKSKTIKIKIEPTNETENGKYLINLNAYLKGTDIIYSTKFDINVKSESLIDKLIPYKNTALIIIGVMFLIIILIAVLKKIKKEKSRKEKIKREDKKVKKERKETKKIKTKKKKTFNWWRATFGLIIVLAVAAAIKTILFYFTIDQIKDAIILYKDYIIAGIAILIALILILNYYKPVLDFFFEEENEKPRKRTKH